MVFKFLWLHPRRGLQHTLETSMTLTVHYPISGHTRIYHDLTQRQVNSLISYVSTLQETDPVPVTLKVTA